MIVDSVKKAINFFEKLNLEENKELRKELGEKFGFWWLKNSYSWQFSKLISDLKSIVTRYKKESERTRKYSLKKEGLI